MYAYFKTGFPAFIVLSLCFVFHYPLHSQEIAVRQTTIESNSDGSVNNRKIDTDKDHTRMLIFTSSSQDRVATDKKLHYFALKNNLFYDVALLPNLTAEVYLGKQLSLAIAGSLSWWTFNSDRFYRIQSVGAELRYWINSPYPLHGHAVGVYSMVGNYDIRLLSQNEDSKGWLSYGSWSAGLSYAYSVPVANRVNLEFGLAVGYLGGKYYDYHYCLIHDRWERQAEYNRNYFGPTRVGVSIVWMLGNGSNM
jgi:Protein of unknown function (DUF3575).